jgi:mannosylglycoprotein endo-beta-mannosidase
MNNKSVLSWNVRGLNARARRDAVRTLVDDIRPSIICLQETKLDVIPQTLLLSMLGVAFSEYAYLPAAETRGGILVAGRQQDVSFGEVLIGCYSVTVSVQPAGGAADVANTWWLTAVYGPQEDAHKLLFLEELEAIRDQCSGPWAVTGDFNLILNEADKSNDRIDRANLRRFRRTVARLELLDLHLHGRCFTWSNERENPTLVRLDRVLVSAEWESLFPNAHLRGLGSDASDHCALLLQTNLTQMNKARFHFESYWPKFDDYLDVVAQGWEPPILAVDALARLDHLLHSLVRHLQRWASSRIGDIRSQLLVARELVLRLDLAQERRHLSPSEQGLRKRLKMRCLGLSSLERTMARERSRVRQLREGDANTAYFHLIARGRRRRNYIPALSV